MEQRRVPHVYFIGLILFTTLVLLCPREGGCEEPQAVFTLESAIELVLKRNTQVLAAGEEVLATEALKKQQFTEFLPKFRAGYGYTRLDEEKTAFIPIVTRPQNYYQFTATVDQPLFSGFSTLTAYEISGLGRDIAGMEQGQTELALILDAKRRYFELLQTEKLQTVAEVAVTHLEANAEVSKNFYDVGIIPRNDLLESEVEAANARQDLVVARNNVNVAKSRFNTLLRRPVDAPVTLEDVLTYEPFDLPYEDAVQTALKSRPEIQIAELQTESAQKEVKLAKSSYFPSLDLQANYYAQGDNPDLEGGAGIANRDEWDVRATASWTFWEWGRSRYGVVEKLSRLEQAKLGRIRVEDEIRDQVKQAYLRVKEAEENILAVEKAVEQAEENFRISEERYKEQVATSTDVLDARSLLTRTQTNYYNALSAFHISKAELDRATGVKVVK